jgi:hypothetical protein
MALGEFSITDNILSLISIFAKKSIHFYQL